jgi:hypothetical protein
MNKITPPCLLFDLQHWSQGQFLVVMETLKEEE